MSKDKKQRRPGIFGTSKEPDLENIQMHGALCPECSTEVFISAYSAIVICPECNNMFPIEIPQEGGKIKITGRGQKLDRPIPKGLYAI